MQNLAKGRAERNISVFVLAENRLFRETLSRLFRKRCDFCVAGDGPYEDLVIERIASSQCEILLVDYATTLLELNVMGEILETLPELKILLIGMEDDEGIFLRSVHCGVAGYLLKDASAMDVVTAVRAVARGEAVCPPHLCLALFRYVARQAHEAPLLRARTELNLTRRQQQLVSMVARGLTNKEIASTLNLSEQTVKNHIHRILRQVNADNRFEAVENIRACGLLL